MSLTGQATFRQLVWAALLAGVVTGVLSTLVQLVTTAPVIAQAEAYERPSATSAHEGHHAEGGTHDHSGGDHSDWEPEDGLERTLYTALTTILAAFGYALLLGAALSQKRSAGWRAGLALGAMGFVAFQLAPALGLPPKPPGVPMADILPRQAWWLGTALATALGLASFHLARSRSKWFWIPLGVVLIILPHVVGAPHAPAEPSIVPDELVRRFSVLALATAALFWIVLGALMGHLYGNGTTREATPRPLPSA